VVPEGTSSDVGEAGRGGLGVDFTHLLVISYISARTFQQYIYIYFFTTSLKMESPSKPFHFELHTFIRFDTG
jgi:hypothetical protein